MSETKTRKKFTDIDSLIEAYLNNEINTDVYIDNWNRLMSEQSIVRMEREPWGEKEHI